MEGFRMGTEPIIVKLLDSEKALLEKIDNLSTLVLGKAKAIGKEQGVPAQSRVRSAFIAVITEETGDAKLATKAIDDKVWYHPELAKVTAMFVAEQKAEKDAAVLNPVRTETVPARTPKEEPPVLMTEHVPTRNHVHHQHLRVPGKPLEPARNRVHHQPLRVPSKPPVKPFTEVEPHFLDEADGTK